MTNTMINNELKKFLEERKTIELKVMYNMNDECRGVETDVYRLISAVFCNTTTIFNMVNYLEKYYSKEEKDFIKKIKELSDNLYKE